MLQFPLELPNPGTLSSLSSGSKMWLIIEEDNSFCLLGWLSLMLKINWPNYYHWLSAFSHSPHKSISNSVLLSGSPVYWHFIYLDYGSEEISVTKNPSPTYLGPQVPIWPTLSQQ